ncbi:uncharacterized protein DUF3800 [Paenibacillus cellulosilyticus]|uniref:Uncharacterized protein DUF3800 n=1 Tax=Paenibacillus cellulosilyticus TaxID=375489 RepID=A0A2V2YHB6_9BACL|nr:DUF3800 domain-containing protein [Paenibacillus cellulosilyticus]PWV90582.1 uncharacterized protein DUF3800 [Paenibacillus cellulosilyticus]QKS46783.1 DUF3800 domain-containing protein [Paenibacillus cellulosilyticus]
MELSSVEQSPENKKLIKIENEKNSLLQQLEDGDLRTLTARVALILNHYPETRDSDRLLTLQYWEVFQNELYNKGVITKEAFLKLEQQSDIKRARAKIQNDFGFCQASDLIRGRRAAREEQYRNSQVELSEDATPITYIFCDEAGKTQDYIIVGSMWGHGSSLDTLRIKIKDLKTRINWTIKDEFHFIKVDKKNISIYKELIDLVADHSETIGFKAICFKQVGSALKPDDIVTKLYTAGICDGLQHEVETGRIALPRTLNIMKDEEGGKDKLLMETQRIELRTHVGVQFNNAVNLGYFNSAPSTSSHFLQLADLFTSCLGRRMNVSNGTNAKDELAKYFFEKFGIDSETFTTDKYDFINIRFLN